MNSGLYMMLHALMLAATIACHVFFILYIAKADVTPIRQGSTVLANIATVVAIGFPLMAFILTILKANHCAIPA